MSKSICIKTNNINIVNEFKIFPMDNSLSSIRHFKNYINYIIHYKGSDDNLFLYNISIYFSYIITKFYETNILKNIIKLNYFYFSQDEQNDILKICQENISLPYSSKRLLLISDAVFSYLQENKNLIIDGFINFRIPNYLKYLDSIVDICVNKYILDNEYNEFINLLKSYIASKPCCASLVHLIYQNGTSILLDDKKNRIEADTSIFEQKFLSDISFSSNDFALNILLTLLPEQICIHLLCDEDDFIKSLKLIFDNRIYMCDTCDICSLFKGKTLKI